MRKVSRSKTKAHTSNVLTTAKGLIQKMGDVKEIRVRDNLPQTEKISHPLSQLLQSEVPQGAPLEEYKAALSFIVIAWNLSQLDANARADEIWKLIVELGVAEHLMQRELAKNIERLIVRKESLFPDDHRTIVTWDIRFEGDYMHISAAALAQGDAE